MFWSSEPKKELPPFEEREIPENLALNDEEKQVLAECFKICENGDTEEFLGQYDPYFFIRIVRGYKDYKPRIEETAKAMDKIYKWRKENDLDNILKTELKNAERFNRDLWPCRYHGEDRMGHLVMSEILEQIKPEQLLKEFPDMDDICMLRAQNLEFTNYKKRIICEKRGKITYKHIYIIDLNGLQMAHFTQTIRALLQRVFGLGNTYYPETLYSLYCVNAPMVFRAIWGIVSGWLHPVTQKKIQIHGSDPKPTMIKEGIPLSVIPKWCGGESEGVPFYDDLMRVQKELKEKAAATAAAGNPGVGKDEASATAEETVAEEVGGALAAAAAATAKA